MTNTQLISIFEKSVVKAPFNNSEKTKSDYIKHIGYLLTYLDDKSIADITSKDIKSFFTSIDISDSTYNVYLSAYKTLYKVLNYNEIIDHNPTLSLMTVRNVKHKEKTPLTMVEQQMLIKYSKNTRDKAILTTLLNSGMRINECLTLTLSDYMNRDEDGMITLTNTKRDHDRNIFLNTETINAIEVYLESRKDGCDLLFVSDMGNKMDRGNVSRTIKCIAKRSGYFSDDRISELSNHLCRASFSSTMLNDRNIPIDVVQEVLGHSSIATTRIYAKTSTDRVKMAMCM